MSTARPFATHTTLDIIAAIGEDATQEHAEAIRYGADGALDEVLAYAQDLGTKTATSRALAENLTEAVAELRLRSREEEAA